MASVSHVADYHIVPFDDASFRLLAEALECHVNGLITAKEEATVDPNIESPDDLLAVMASMDEDIRRGKQLLLEVFHVPID